MSIRTKRVIVIAAFFLILAVIIVLSINYFTGTGINDYEGTLVHSIGTTQCYG